MERIELIGTFKSIRRNKGGTDLVLTIDDQQWPEAAKLAATDGFILKINVEVQKAETIGRKA